mgnify:CR=1 FL=1
MIGWIKSNCKLIKSKKKSSTRPSKLTFRHSKPGWVGTRRLSCRKLKISGWWQMALNNWQIGWLMMFWQDKRSWGSRFLIMTIKSMRFTTLSPRVTTKASFRFQERNSINQHPERRKASHRALDSSRKSSLFSKPWKTGSLAEWLIVWSLLARS